ncbi:MAG TPA: glutaredoxin family protein [Gaiellaceae bacterium]
MADVHRAEDVDADGRLRPGGAAGGRSNGDPRALPLSRVALFHAQGCHLCERAREQLARLRDELGFELEEVDITGVPELEERYREWLPVVEIDGERAFVYYLDEAAFRRKVGCHKDRPL